MPYRLKDTGESYAQFLERNRNLERKAKDCLPENRKAKREWDMQEELTKLLEDKETVLMGWMNSFTPDNAALYKHLVESGVQFSRVRQNGYWEYYNVAEKVVFKVDSGG